MSTLKHNIRQQQAQLHNLENTILRGPRPLPPGVFNSPPMSPDEFDDPSSSSGRSHSHTPSTSTFPSSPLLKLQRRSSYEVLSGLAGPESNLPLPRPSANGGIFGEEGGIREGIPALSPSKRVSSPTRTLSPSTEHAPAGHARALAEEANDSGLGSSMSSMQPAVSPSRRSSFAPGNTTKVLADLQAGVLNAKHALENTKGQLRLSQRQVSQLTRQSEDLKEVRERLRLENEGLNNVVARKERLLQEVLERARKAEAEVVALKSQLKNETSTSKRTIRDTEAALTESQARAQKCEREYVTLRDSLKGLVASFKTDHDGLREEMRKREDRMRKEAEEVRKKYMKLVEEVKKDREVDGRGMKEVVRLKEESENARREVEESLREEVQRLRTEVDRSNKESEGAIQTAKNLSEELARLRRLMRASGRRAATC
ncbi:hypothetical protein PHLGIDRAFT_26828 [Phlebiopsis gigantea 11061_1 CR5-6]|uniref:SWI5-dependent HO expression protein 3 n=1 Tax=Phlebiopsis gigantea (strain 11061_1 CR5-6) TaxID=745531 RepID=A0A0C3RQ78_PHLG1|nr:hypothetical protein PHLGIDRAFT_26828 [Phlebiopsis gigantea 11061_1 CR5-6]